MFDGIYMVYALLWSFEISQGGLKKECLEGLMDLYVSGLFYFILFFPLFWVEKKWEKFFRMKKIATMNVNTGDGREWKSSFGTRLEGAGNGAYVCIYGTFGSEDLYV